MSEVTVKVWEIVQLVLKKRKRKPAAGRIRKKGSNLPTKCKTVSLKHDGTGYIINITLGPTIYHLFALCVIHYHIGYRFSYFDSVECVNSNWVVPQMAPAMLKSVDDIFRPQGRIVVSAQGYFLFTHEIASRDHP